MQKITADLSRLPSPFNDGSTAQRVETGPLQINDDWPGVFIRGDNAMAFAYALSRVLAHLDNPEQPLDIFSKYPVKSLVDTLRGCVIVPGAETVSEAIDAGDQEVGC